MPTSSTKAALAVLVVMTWIIVCYIVWRHICHWTRPQLQKCYVRICLLLPIFSLCALIVFLSPHYGVYMEAVRALAEGYALYGFFVALVIYAGGEQAVCRAYEHPEFLETEFVHTMFCGLWQWKNTKGEEVLQWHKKCIYQLMYIKPLSALAMAIVESNYNVKEGAPKTVYTILSLLGFASMTVLMRTLLAVYLMTKSRLDGMAAIRKFTVVKLLVFITITQGLIINMIVAGEGITPQPDETIAEAGSRLQSMMGIIEMFLFSFIFALTFTYKDFSVLPLSLAAASSDYHGNIDGNGHGNAGLGQRSLSSSIDITNTNNGFQSTDKNDTIGNGNGNDVSVGVSSSSSSPYRAGGGWKRPSAPVMSPCAAFCQIFHLSDFFTRPLEESEDTPLLED